MLTNDHKKVICVKNIPSNIIEEAFFILKTDKETSKNPRSAETKKDLLLQETRDFLHTYSFDFENERRKKELWKKKEQKLKYALGICAFLFVSLLVSVIICM